ncbi:MAG: prepilin-type N-terminal cleavage/methylation domain-containing protein [Candidatus Sumerlaeaceae bacterium]
MRKGFTLIELLIVVAIIAILAAIAVPNFLEAQTRSKVSRCKADMRSLVTALESYAVDNNKYPPPADCALVTPANNGQAWGSYFHSRIPNYLTTPIGYVTSLYEDPFVVQTSTYSSATYPAATRVGMRYVYYETEGMVTNLGDFWSGTLVPWLGKWAMYGYGPDRTPFQGSKATLLPYDPTNGTVSPGNIVRCQKNVDGTPVNPGTGTFFWP